MGNRPRFPYRLCKRIHRSVWRPYRIERQLGIDRKLQRPRRLPPHRNHQRQCPVVREQLPTDTAFKKEEVKGVSAKVITAAILAGDCYPSTPIGINLPNADWIRHVHGSKSVTIENITSAYDKAAQGNGFNQEFMWSDTERKSVEKYGFLVDNLHTDLHECLGHGSGKLLPGTDPDAMRSYSSTLEETRADLFALYFLADKKLIELGLVPDAEAYKAEYYRYMMNGLMTQLTRIAPGKNIEESHMRNRQLIARWILEKGADDKVLELRKRDGKTYVVVNDYEKMRTLIGELLAEVQRIKSTGDYEAGKKARRNLRCKSRPRTACRSTRPICPFGYQAL